MISHFLWSVIKILGKIKVRGVWRTRKLILNTLFKDKYFKTPYLGHHIYVCPTHIMGRFVFEGQVYEPEIIKIIQTFVQNNFSYIDIGANIGLHTLAAAFERQNLEQFFYSFEPEAAMYSMLKKNCSLNGLDFVNCVRVGIGDKDAVLSLNVSLTSNKGRNSFLPIDNSKPGQEVKVATLDSLFLDNQKLSESPLFIKIDVEGYELPVIRGGRCWLSTIKDIAIICEVWPELMERNNMTVDSLFSLFRECGFDQHKLISGETGNAIFYKGDLAGRIVSRLLPE
ncbi:MAG: FkbM family methyltransferase [Anaerolineales bacterium]|nr:FkbM family methyltransferase [Anaerolineales bacterium]